MIAAIVVAWVCVLVGFVAGAIFANERQPDPTPPRPRYPSVRLMPPTDPQPYDWQRERVA